VNSETKKNRPYLRCEFYGEPYHGVAYGTVGLVYMLIKAVYAVPSMQGVQELMAAIEGSLYQILDTMGDSGVLPIKQGESSYQVNFFHGAPGAIPMLTQAAWAFPHLRDRLLDTASKAGELTWNEGFIPQDNGLSNGCAGNGYALHCLFRTYELLS